MNINTPSINTPICQPPASPRSRRFRTPVRGNPFAVAPAAAAPLTPGQAVQLRREPGNPADALAIAVWADAPRPWRVGYLDRSVAAWLARALDLGRATEARFDGWTREPSGRWRRPVIVVELGAPSDLAAEHASARAYRADGDASLWGRPPGSRRRVVGGG